MFSGIYLGQEFAIIPSVRIVIANALVYFRGLPDPNVGENVRRGVIDNNGWFATARRYFFW